MGALNQAGIHAAFLNSSLSMGQYRKALDLAREGRYKIIYVAPERLETEGFLRFALSPGVDISFWLWMKHTVYLSGDRISVPAI